MKRIIALTCVAAAIAALLSSCHREPLYITDFYDTFDLVIRPRWSEMDSRPTGMTAFIYPTEGGDPTVLSSNDVDSIAVRLHAGGYRILLMNLTPAEFPSLEFSRMESFYDAKVSAAPQSKEASYALIPDCTYCQSPEILAIDCCNELKVDQSEIREYEKKGQRVRKVVTMKPHVIVSTLYIDIPVEGIYNAWSATGCIDGMSRQIYMTYFDTGTERAAHEIPTWKPSYESVSSIYGSLSASVTTLGMPGTSLYLSSGASVETSITDIASITRSETDPVFKPEDIFLHISVLLADKKTVITKDYPVGDLITRRINQPLVLNLKMEEMLFLPFVPPADGSGMAGFDVSVEDWFEEEHDIYF